MELVTPESQGINSREEYVALLNQMQDGELVSQEAIALGGIHALETLQSHDFSPATAQKMIGDLQLTISQIRTIKAEKFQHMLEGEATILHEKSDAYRAEAGTEIIAAERARQIKEEGFTPKLDQMNNPGELASAAIVYAMYAISGPDMRKTVRKQLEILGAAPKHWPFKNPPKLSADSDNQARIRELVKAGALIAAEIDRTIGDT